MNREKLEGVAGFYNVEKDFDFFNTMLAAGIILPYCEGKAVLEVGSADGVMTGELLKVCGKLTVVEPTAGYCDILRKRYSGSINIFCSFLEEVKERLEFDVIVLAGLLHHIKDTAVFLDTVKRFLKRDGTVLATVPNMTSLHRRIGARAGMLNNEYGDTERNIKLHQFGRYDKNSFESLFRRCGYEMIESYGYMLKPFSSEQMMSLNLGWDVINALFELGKENEHMASQLFIRAKLSR